MADKEIRFNATLDSSQLDQAFANIKQKMKSMQDFTSSYAQINKASSGGTLPGMSPQAQQAYEQVFKRQTDSAKQAYIDQLSNIEKVAKAIKSNENNLEKETLKLKEKNKTLKEQEDIQENITKLMREQSNLSNELQGRMREAGVLAGAAGVSPQRNNSMLGSVTSAIGGTAMLAVVKTIGDEFVRRQVEVSKMQGSATAGTTGRILSQMQSGDFAYEGMFGRERSKAAETARTAESRGRGWDLALLAGSAAALGIGGLMTATGVGAVPGLALMGMGSTGMVSKRNMFDREKYEAERASQFSSDFNDVAEAEKQKAPFRKDAIELLQKNAPAYLNYQRTLGLSDSALFSNLSNITNAGFKPEMGLDASAAILGAGGGTQMGARGDIALRAQRGLGLTNAPQLLGMLGGTQGIPETSKRSLIDIFAHGIDASKYAEENRQFMQNTAESIAKGGTTSESAADTIARIMGAFTGNATTMQGVSAGKSAYETFQNNASQTSGYQGAINVAGLLSSNSAIRKIKDPAVLQSLASLQPQEIDPDDPFIQSVAHSIGMDPKELAEILVNQKIRAVGTGLARPDALKSFAAKQQRYKDTYGTLEGFGKGDFQGADSEFSSLVGMHRAINPGETLKTAEAAVNGLGDLTNMTDEERLAKMKTTATGKYESKDSDRSIDMIVSASAENAKTALQTLSESISKFALDTFRAAGTMSDNINKAKEAGKNLEDAENRYSAAESRMKANTGHYTSEFDYIRDKNALTEAAVNRSKAQATATAANKATVSGQ